MSTELQLATLARLDGLMQALAERANGALANQRAALETLQAIPEEDREMRARFFAIVAEEAAALAAVVERARRDYTAARNQAWPMELVAADELVDAAARRIRDKLAIAMPASCDTARLRVEPFPLVQALCCIASRLVHEHGARDLALAARAEDTLVRFQVRWQGAPLAIEAWHAWERQPLRYGGEASHARLGEVLRRHGGEAWHGYEAAVQAGHIDLALPAARD